jgi:hypothetical protein
MNFGSAFQTHLPEYSSGFGIEICVRFLCEEVFSNWFSCSAALIFYSGKGEKKKFLFSMNYLLIVNRILLIDVDL